QPARRPRALGRARRYRARAPAHGAEFLRAKGRHRRAGLRPVAQSLQGSGVRHRRAPPSEGDPRRAGEAGGGDPAGDEGAGGNAGMTAWRREPFDAVISDVSGGNLKTPQSEYQPAGRYPIVDQGKDLIGGYTDDESRL